MTKFIVLWYMCNYTAVYTTVFISARSPTPLVDLRIYINIYIYRCYQRAILLTLRPRLFVRRFFFCNLSHCLGGSGSGCGGGRPAIGRRRPRPPRGLVLPAAGRESYPRPPPLECSGGGGGYPLESSRRRRVVQFRVTLVSGGAPRDTRAPGVYFRASHYHRIVLVLFSVYAFFFRRVARGYIEIQPPPNVRDRRPAGSVGASPVQRVWFPRPSAAPTTLFDFRFGAAVGTDNPRKWLSR